MAQYIDLKAFRKNAGLTQKELSAFFGNIDEGFISRIEQGKAKLPEAKLTQLIHNKQGWIVAPFLREEPISQQNLVNVATNSHDIHQVTADDKLIAVIQEQQAQLGRLITVIENLTSNAK